MKPVFTTIWMLDLGVLGEREVEVDFHYSVGHPGSWYRKNGDPGDPPEPDEIEVVSVRAFTLNGDKTVDITDLAADYLSDSEAFAEHATEVFTGAMAPEET